MVSHGQWRGYRISSRSVEGLQDQLLTINIAHCSSPAKGQDPTKGCTTVEIHVLLVLVNKMRNAMYSFTKH